MSWELVDVDGAVVARQCTDGDPDGAVVGRVVVYTGLFLLGGVAGEARVLDLSRIVLRLGVAVYRTGMISSSFSESGAVNGF